MDLTGSCLLTAIEKVRILVEQAQTDKYTDDELLRNFLYPAYANCLVALSMEQDNPVFVRSSLSVVAQTSYYELPPMIETVLRLARYTTDNVLVDDIKPENFMSPQGPNWRLEGNMIVFDPIPTEAVNYELWYIPSGDICMHYGTGVYTNSTTGAITLASSPTLGMLDKRPNGYVGAVLRIINGGVIQERIISAHNASTNLVTPRLVWGTGMPAQGQNVVYEIAPLGHRPVWEMMAHQAALAVGGARGVTQAKLIQLDTEYRRARKFAFDRISNLQGRVGKSYARGTIDNPEASLDLWNRGLRGAVYR